MKKYIIGLISAICLMGAGCTEFEDFEPVDMGDGPSVKVALEKTAVDAFNLTVTPGEGTVYYAYIVSNEAMSLEADNLLQAKYEGAVLLNASETPSVAKSFTGQEIGTTYYVYAVASNDKGLCGAIESATLELPDAEAPHIVDNSMLYTATNQGRTITITFNETVVRGDGAISYSLNTISGTSFEPYKEGTIESVVINAEKVTITLPDDAEFNETEGVVTYVFIKMAEGAFEDASGNKSQAMQDFDADMSPLFPWWQYVPGGSTGGDSDFTGTFGFMFYQYDFDTKQPGQKPYGFDTEFELKYEDNPDTIVIKNFYFEASAFIAGGNTLEAVVEGNDFKIADMLPMGIVPMNGGIQGLLCFAGLPESESDVFEWVNFKETVASGSTGYVADRWCGLYVFDYAYIDDPTNENFSLGWIDLWNLAVFMKGSIQSSPSTGMNATAPVLKKLNARQVDWSQLRPLTGAEKMKAQAAVKHMQAKRF
ncbi:hypothetical protein QUW50_02655 [Barnesiella viscericola]|uniref:hypothetical protein n=1 Tax=Barnesiella viscericola TaxID=397865 RepID=UPI0025A4CAC8|nr:hypothetical protein [Barnesiella viscericola]MDM8267933.1 hypothetical protein [Barnesiella viscericola]